MKVGFSYHGVWDAMRPGHQLDTPDGHRYGRKLFMQEVVDQGNMLYLLQPRREETHFAGAIYPLEGFPNVHVQKNGNEVAIKKEYYPDLDVIFMEWRWSTYKNDKTHPKYDPLKYEADLDRQCALLAYYHDKIPIIVWDTDLKLTAKDEEKWPNLIIADPSFETNRLTRDRVSLPFWTDWKEMLPTADPYPIYGYIGNNYERDDEFENYFFNLKQSTRIAGIQTAMYGNWLQSSPERPRPTALISTHREVAFNHRMNFFDSMKMLNKFICTTHISKPRYYEVGFMSPRYLEALAVNCPAMVPHTFKESNLLGALWTVEKTSDVMDRIRLLRNMSLANRQEIVEEQRYHLQRQHDFHVDSVVEFITEGHSL